MNPLKALNSGGEWLVNAATLVAVAVLVAAGLIGHHAAMVLASTDAWVDHSRQVDLAMQRLIGAVIEAESAERGYLLTGTPSYLDAYGASVPRVQGELAGLTALIADNAAQQARVPELAALISKRLAILQQGIDLRRSSFEGARDLVIHGEGAQTMDRIRERIALMQSSEADLLQARQGLAARAHRQDRIAVLAVCLLAALLVAVMRFVARRDARRLRQSEQRLATTFASIGDAVLATDGSGCIERMNALAEQLTGWPLSEARGQPLDKVFVILNEDTRQPVENPVKKVLREGGAVGLANHSVLISRSGKELAIEDSAAPIDGEGAPGSSGVVLVFRDATKVRALERARELSERRFREIADGMPQIVYVTNGEAQLEYLNRRWYTYTGRHEVEPPGMESAIHPDDREPLAQAWQTARQDETALQASFRLLSREGEWRWFLTRAVPVRDPETLELRWYGTSTDINEQVLARDALTEADRRKDEFLATLAHELRNPLAPIRNAAHVLRTAPLDSAARPWAAEVIDRQVRIMAALLDDLLDVARITRGTLMLQKQRLTLRSIVEAALETAQPLITAHEHKVSVDLPSEEILLLADPVRLTQVLANLLTNAAKYTDAGGTISIRGGADGESAWFAVRDSGIGLDAASIGYIFGLFAQVTPGRGSTESGLGIGLALVKGIVELHGGRVSAVSEGIGKGSEFRVTLPRGDAAASAPPAMVFASVPAQRGLRVLVADDNVDGAQSMAALLELSGHRVAVAHDGSGAVSLSEAFRPQLAVIDIGMPLLNGYEVARQLRALPWAQGLFLIAVTGWGQESDRRRAIDAGFDEHLVKPVEAAALLDLIVKVAASEGG